MQSNTDVKHEVGERIYAKCSNCCMITEQIIIEATWEDSESAQCIECQNTNEWLIEQDNWSELFGEKIIM